MAELLRRLTLSLLTFKRMTYLSIRKGLLRAILVLTLARRAVRSSSDKKV
jgi:hypothetical protein